MTSLALGVVIGLAASWLIARFLDWVDQPGKPEPRELGPNGYGHPYGEL